MILKKCGLKDVNELAALGRETYFDSFQSMNNPETMSLYLDKAFSYDRIAGELRNEASFFYLFYSDTRAAAYLKVNFSPAQTDINDPDYIEIERIYVRKNYWGRGIGTLLINHSVELGEDNGCHYAWLGVWEQNLKAIRFYRRMGFEVFGGHQFRMGDELQSDLMMRRKIRNTERWGSDQK